LPLVAETATDAQLVARCRDGDREAWNELIERFSRYVYAICIQGFRLASHDAEDVFQEVFARVYQHLDRLRSDEAIRPWIAQLTRRLCLDRLRGAGREGPAELGELESSRLDETLPREPDGSIELTARAWAVRGRNVLSWPGRTVCTTSTFQDSSQSSSCRGLV